MRNPLADKVVDIKPSGIRKFFDIVSEMEDAISLGVGEPDFDTPWHIRDEGIYSLEKGRTFYTSNAGLKELKIEISKYLDRKYGMKYNYNNEIMVTVGGSEGIDMALRAMLDPGDEVIIPQPSYVSYEPCTVLAGGKPVIVELKEENEFRLTAEELEEAITPKSKILIMPFPNNPTGAVMELNDIEAIAKVVKEHDLYEGKMCTYKWFFKGLCNDRLETGICLCAKRNFVADVKDTSVCNNVCTYDKPVCSSGSNEKR